jgi:dihydropyrimidinase
MKTLVRHGTLVTAADTFAADVLVDDGKIVLIGIDLPADDAQVVEAQGKLVLPGGVDVHTHLELPTSGTVASDDFYTGHKAAAFGGTTTHIDFAMQPKGGSLRDGLEIWHGKAADKAVIDYSFHANITDFNDTVLDEIPWLAEEGVTSLKVLLAYKGVLQVDDTALFKSLMLAAEAGVLVMVHAENGDAIDVLVKDAIARGRVGLDWHARTRPAWLEGEATLRACALAAAAGAPLYVVHMTCGLAVDQLAYARAHDLPVMGETCPQYLFFTEEDLKRPDGAKWVCSPPLRTASDQAALWAALQNHTLQTVATDHCPFFFDGTQPIDYEGRLVAIPGKELGGGQFPRMPNGVPGLGDRLVTLWDRGVNTGRLTPNRFVELTATNPARIFGLYPRKGTLAVGSDADLVIWDPQLKKTLGVATSRHRTDYNLYEGWQVTGWPEKVFRRGELLVDGDTWRGRPGSGEYLARRPAQVI